MRIRLLLLPLLLPTPASAQGAPAPAAAPGDVVVLDRGDARAAAAADAERDGLLVVDLSDDWAPFIFSESDGPGSPSMPNAYRGTFIALANDRVTPDELFLESRAGRSAVLSAVPAALRSTSPGELSPQARRALARARQGLQERRAPNFLEVFGIPPTLSVLARRVEEDTSKGCFGGVDVEAIRRLDVELSFQSRQQARREYEAATADAAGAAADEATLALASASAADRPLEVDPGAALRLERARRAQTRLGAVRAIQARLACEGLLGEGRYQPGAFDLATHESLAAFERKNDLFGWGFVSGETQAALERPPLELHLETFRRILAERVADAAGIVEDGSAARGDAPATWVDATGETHPVPNLVGDFVDALAGALGVRSPDDLARFLRERAGRGFAHFRVAFRPPPLPPYYAHVMDLSAEIDRGDVWYDFPFDARGRPIVQLRRRYPTFTLYARWRDQKIPLVRWRTTIGSWRSELGADGHVYLKYKNSDVGPRIWKNVVAGPVWVPPDATPAKDLVTKKVLDPRQGPVTVVNTEIMGPGFASAYGLVMAVHLEKLPNGGLFDDKIRTHGSVDYTSIARRFSHGCHRLVNNRAVRLFDFVLRHRRFRRIGSATLRDFRRRFVDHGRRYEYELATRGYYFELVPPLAIDVLEGRVRGAVREPITAYLRKPGVDYGPLPSDSPVEVVPVAGP